MISLFEPLTVSNTAALNSSLDLAVAVLQASIGSTSDISE